MSQTIATQHMVEVGVTGIVSVDSISFQGCGGRDDSLLNNHLAIWMPKIDTRRHFC